MTNNTLKIQIPQGFEIDTLDKSTGVISFKAKPKNVLERIKTVDDLLADHGYTQERFNKLCEDLSEDEKAYRILKLLALTLNEGWTPDWNDANQYKYFAWFYVGGSSGFRYHVFDVWNTRSSVGSRLCFKSAELAKYAGQQFTEVYKSFMTI